MARDLWSFVHRCTGCKLKWILYTEHRLPDRHCPFCHCPLVRSKVADG